MPDQTTKDRVTDDEPRRDGASNRNNDVENSSEEFPLTERQAADSQSPEPGTIEPGDEQTSTGDEHAGLDRETQMAHADGSDVRSAPPWLPDETISSDDEDPSNYTPDAGGSGF